MTNVGIDFVAFNNRLNITADWYVKNTKDILLTVPIPISSGGANDPIRNAGKIRNKGFEFNVAWNTTVNQDLSYGVSVLGSFNKNEVTAMGTGSQAIWGGATNQNINTCKTMAGYPISTVKRKWKRILKTVSRYSRMHRLVISVSKIPTTMERLTTKTVFIAAVRSLTSHSL